MSQNGNTQNNLAIQKKNLLNQKSGATFYVNLEFAHESAGGESVINFNSLIAPSEAVSLEGFSNPLPSELIQARITQNRGNVRLHSSLRGDLQRFTQFYIKEDNQIRLTFETAENEIITGMINNVVRTTPSIIDVKKISFTGSLAESASEVVIGAEYNINANPTTQLGEIIVYRWQGSETPKLMVRCEGNDLLNDGNYIEKLNAIEFKEGGRVGGENIAVFSPNCVPTLFQNSFKTDLETLGGQVDLISEFLQDVHSLPTNPFQGAPNQVDLRSFGQKVIDLERLYNTLVSKVTEETCLFTGFVSKGGPSSLRVQFANQLRDTSNVLLTPELNNGGATRITFLKECNFVATCSFSLSGQNSNIAIELRDSNDNIIIRNNADANLTATAGTGMTTRANAGDYLLVFVGSVLTPLNTTDTTFSVTATETKDVTIGSLIP